MNSTLFDCHMMAMALTLARRGLGTTAPNPAVGAVIADPATGEAIARGWTQPGGRPHAEAEALRRAGDRARGATIYVTLEPCAHQGRAGSCVDAIIAAGIRRVVVGVADCDPRTAGLAAGLLKAAGIVYAAGPLREEAHWVTLGHILRFTRERPFVQLKLAVSADEFVAAGEHGRPRWVTGEEARARGHLLRAEADAILVGRRTIEIDDPELTCRLPGLEGHKLWRLILDRNYRTPRTAHVFRTAERAPTMVIGGLGDPDQEVHFPPGVHTSDVRLARPGRLDLEVVLNMLAYNHGVTRLLVEGGPTVARSFMQGDLVDEVVIFRGAESIDPAAEKLEPLHGRGLKILSDGSRWREVENRPIGRDRCLVFRRTTR